MFHKGTMSSNSRTQHLDNNSGDAPDSRRSGVLGRGAGVRWFRLAQALGIPAADGVRAAA